MAKYRIAWLPGDGIGQDVLEAADIVLKKLALDAELHPRRHRLGVLVHGGRSLSAAHNRALISYTRSRLLNQESKQLC